MQVRSAAVLGRPIAHSKSPQLHLAAYRALGLTTWTYDRIECTAEQLPGLVSALSAEWVGLSVTMPCKGAALKFATRRSERAEIVGSANTLVRTPHGWRADCTDIDGVSGALAEVGTTDISGANVVVVGAGGTARPALVALAGMGARHVTIVARDESRARSALSCAQSCGMTASLIGFEAGPLGRAASGAAVLVNTAPADALGPIAEAAAQCAVVLDAIYDPWPTPLAVAVHNARGTIIGGLRMLINQAFGQVEQFTGMPAPRQEMEHALAMAVQ